jgi:uncharacterized protein
MAPVFSRLYERLVDLLIRRRGPIFIAALVTTIVCTVPASRLSFDQSIETLYANDDPHLRDYQNSKRWFGGDELVGVAYQDPQVFDESGEQRLLMLSAELAEIPGVRAESTQNLARNMAAANLPLLSRRKDQIIELFRGLLIGADGRTTSVLLRLVPESEAPVPRGRTIAEIRRVAQAHELSTGLATYVVGEPVQVHDMFRYVQEDGAILGWTSSLLLIGVILVLFRRIRWVILPVLVVQATLVWTKAILVLSHLQLSMVSSILNSLVTVIGVATVMHITLVYCEHREHLDRFAALHKTFSLLGTNIFWVCATTAGGFAAQLSSHVFPVYSFGLMMTLGAMLVLVAIAVFLPGGILLGKRTADPYVTPADAHVGRGLLTIAHWIETYPWRLAAVCAAIAAVALSGMSRIRVETDFSRNFRKSSPIVRALDFVEAHLGGAGTWEVNFPAPAELDDAFLERVRELAAKLRELRIEDPVRRFPIDPHPAPPLTKVTAITDGLDVVPTIPILASTLEKRLRILSSFQPEFVPSLYNPKAGRMRIILRARERQPAETKQLLIDRVQEIARNHFPVAEEENAPRATGLYVLLTFLVQSLLGDQWVSFGWGAAAMITMMTLAFRSLRIGLISLIPNLLPIVIVIGTMGWLDFPINIASAMISTVSLGLTIDASIFYISGFRRARRQGLDSSQALRATQRDVGRALVYACLALVIGFLVLTLSHFVPLIYFGVLVSVAMIGGLFGNLVLLPLMIRATRTDTWL